VAVDDTLFHRSGKKVWAASWFHDGSGKGKDKVGYGNNWVIAGVVVTIPVLGRVVCLPVLARLVRKGGAEASRLHLAVEMVSEIAVALPGRTVHGVGDAAYAGKELCDLPGKVTWTTRVRKDADLYKLPPPRTGRRGRPRLKGDQLPKLEQIAASLTFTPATVTRYGRTETAYLASFVCLWPGVFGYKPVTITLVRNKPGIPRGGFDIALATTDAGATPAQVVERYSYRWSIEVAIEDSKQVFGVGQTRNRVKLAVERTVPFGLACQTLATVWYATAGHDPADVEAHRERAPWYTAKRHPSTADLAAKLRRVLIAAKFRGGCPGEPTQAEIHAIQLAWETEAA
jgi:DDE superfamily endonuclease